MIVDAKVEVMNRLKEEITKRRWNDEHLAEHLDESVFTVNKWLHLHKFPQPVRARKLLKFLTDDLLQASYFKNSSNGGKLFLLRNWEGLSIQSAAYALGISHSALSNWEKDKRLPTDSDMRKVLRFYGVTPSETHIELGAETFGDRLQDERVMADMTQSKLSQKTNISPTRLSHFENNKTTPAPDELRRLADSLNITIEMLILAEDGLPFTFKGMEATYSEDDWSGKMVHITYITHPTKTKPKH